MNSSPFSVIKCLSLSDDKLAERQVVQLDIAFDDLSSDKHYKREEDPKFYRSTKTNRGPLLEGWRDDQPIMCSYKLVNASFEVWGFQTRVEDYIHRCISDVLLLGHRQAFTWIDNWIDMSIDDVREYEKRLQAETNKKLAGECDKETSAEITEDELNPKITDEQKTIEAVIDATEKIVLTEAQS